MQGEDLTFLERLLAVMDRKHHWAWSHFSGPTITRQQLQIHFRQEYAVYVRDFPVFLARVHGMNPPQPIRTMLAENIYEEDTGGLSVGRSHPMLFLEMMEGLGYARTDFQDVPLLPASRTYHEWLEQATHDRNWVVGVAVLTIFVEGSLKDRGEIAQPSPLKTQEEIERLVNAHPLARYHGLSPKAMDLIRAHQLVEAGHRHAAYEMVLGRAMSAEQQTRVLDALDHSLTHWLRYRDGIAEACGLGPG